MFYFFLGNTPELSLLELRTLYPGQFDLVAKEVASFMSDLDLSSLPRLGGTRKVAQELAVVSPKQLKAKLVQLISLDSAKNIALTDYANQNLERSTIHDLKSTISRSIRFVALDTTEHELLMLSRQHVSEFNLIPSGENIAIAKTVWIFDAENWVSRDRDKPYRDIKHGMLPPKVAGIMVTLATRGQSGLTLADPFCGTGTILAEAMMVGCSVIGSDTNPDAIEGSKSNLAWLASSPNLRSTIYDLHVADATHFSETVDAVATEPYMGPLLDERNPSSLAKIKNIAKGLDKLYRGCLKSWQATRIVISIPSFHVYNRVIETISIDTISSLGYNVIASVPYSKPGAAVIRNITVLEKNVTR